MSISDKEEYSQILTYIYYRGAVNEGKIANDLKIKKSIVILTVRDLFAKGFLLKTDNKLKLTRKAISVLEDLGFGQLTSDYLVSEEIKSPLDAIFLKAYCSSNLNKNNEVPITIKVRNLKTSINLFYNDLDDESKSNAVWTIVIGDNNFLKFSNQNVFVNKIFDFHKTNDTDFWKLHGEKLESNSEYFVERCGRSLTNYYSINEKIAERKKISNNFFKIILITRVLCVLKDKMVDEELKTLWTCDDRIIKKSLENIVDKEHDIWENYYSVLNSEYKNNSIVNEKLDKISSSYKFYPSDNKPEKTSKTVSFIESFTSLLSALLKII